MYEGTDSARGRWDSWFSPLVVWGSLSWCGFP